MLDPVFSFQFIWIAGLIILLSTALAYLCACLAQQLLYVAAGEWLVEHIYCPVAKVLILIVMTFLLFPLMFESVSYGTLLGLFTTQDFLINMVNVLFASSLAISFIPLLNHPAVTMPLLGCIASGIFFLHLIALPGQIEFSWFPGLKESLKLLLLIIICYWICRWLINHVSLWIDLRFIVTGSKSLVSDVSYLIFQMPVVLAYGHGLALQT